MKILNSKWNGILYEGGFGNFSVNGSCHMEKEVLYKNNPSIEAKTRLNMAYLLSTNPEMIEIMQKNKSCFFHGTNANALPSILKYGINSVNASIENNIDVITGEEWSRIDGKRKFVSLNSSNTLLNFGVIIGASFEDMSDIIVSGVHSDISEIGVIGNLPLNHIKFFAVPDDKTEFVKKMVGEKNIDVVSMDMKDRFSDATYIEKLNMIESVKKNPEPQNPPYPTYSKSDVKPLVTERKTSKIKEIFEALKSKIHTQIKQTDDKSITERG